jgi:hypothetical protein
MKTEACEWYLADPEANSAHLETCEECRLLFGSGGAIEVEPIAIDSLPIAAWEGAGDRSWPLVAVAALLVAGGACAFFLAAGISPLRGIATAVGTMLPSIEILQSLTFRVGSALQHVPAAWQIAVGIAFLVVNGILLALLRRAPKGIDV